MDGYDREKAIAYAREWAYARNPKYLDFHGLGGDCTNFVSQCLYAGCGVMNRSSSLNWYYVSPDDRAASWTGVEYCYVFLVNNKGAGPHASEVAGDMAVPGDVVQLGWPSKRYSHAALIVEVRDGEAYLAAHSTDAFMRPISTYAQPVRRFLHIDGSRPAKR